MRRREFIAGLGGAAASWSVAARAQQQAMPVIGFLRNASSADATHLVNALRRGLKEAGFVEGENVAIEYGWAENDGHRLSTAASEFVSRPVNVIVGNLISAQTAKAATTTVPIVFATGSDPVQDGLVSSLNRPGGNVTGLVFFAAVLGAKRLELLHQIVPKAATIGVLVNPGNSNTEAERNDVRVAAEAIGRQLIILDVRSAGAIEAALATFVERGAGALFVGAGSFMNAYRERIVALAARHALPAIYPLREFVAAGGLMSYGASITDAYRQVGIYVGRILNGEKPGDLPVMQSTKVDLVLNSKTAKTLGIAISPTLLALADEVIE
jgi:putative tryptophan/tyrosine transport system substrate-binding protein